MLSLGPGARALAAVRWPELVAALIAVLVYLPSLGFGFVFDDGALIAPDGSPLPLGAGLPYRPLRYASYLVDSWLGGSAAVYHAHNVLLHAAVVALVVAMARRLGSSSLAALAGGLLVAAHPLAVEAVAYVSGRRDLLCVALGLAAVLAHLKGRLAAALGLLVLSVAAKESGLVFVAPLVLATLAGLDPRTAGSNRRFAVVVTAIASTAAAALALTFAYGAIGPWAPATGIVGLALPGRVTAHYLGSLSGLRTLAPEYPELLSFVDRVQHADAAAAFSGAVITVLLALAAATSLALCVRARVQRRRREGAFVLAWVMAAFAALALWGGLHEPGADRHAYLVLAPLGIALAMTLSWIESAPARAVIAIAIVAGLVVSASSSRRQMEIWRGERELWSHVTSVPAASPRAHSNMARALAADGSYRAAARHMNTAVDAAPRDSSLYVGRAALRCAQGRRFLARRDLSEARRLGADSALLADVTRECVRAASGAAAGHAS